MEATAEKLKESVSYYEKRLQFLIEEAEPIRIQMRLKKAQMDNLLAESKALIREIFEKDSGIKACRELLQERRDGIYRWWP